MEKRLIIGSDHAGFELKEKIKAQLTREGFEIEDVGTHSAARTDYPVYAKTVSRAILAKKFNKGILVCGTGLGMCYTANRFKGIRAALATSKELAEMASRHNNANVLCLGGRTTSIETSMEIIKAWLTTPFEGGRHEKRINMIDEEN
jgi:ribose 5-phosphate isomerase B